MCFRAASISNIRHNNVQQIRAWSLIQNATNIDNKILTGPVCACCIIIAVAQMAMSTGRQGTQDQHKRFCLASAIFC